MKLKVFSFTWESFSADSVVSATLMTTTWEITILENHSPLLTSMNPSNLNIVYLNSSWEKVEENFAIWKGIVEVSFNEIKVMADMLISMEVVDLEAAEQARQKALELMEKYKNSQDKVNMDDYIQAEDMLLRSVAQLKLHKL